MRNSNLSGNYSMDTLFSDTDKCLQYRFLIPQAAAGAIISKKGENIKRLREKYSCGINVPQSNGPERLLVINADIDTLCLVMAEIFELVKDCMHSKINDPKDIISGTMPDNSIAPEMDLRFLVSENVCGAIIGKGGEVIRRLTDTYLVSVMKVHQQMCPASTDRVIRIVGLPEDLLSCMRGIHEVIMTLKDIKSIREYDPNDFNEIHAVNYGGWMTTEARRTLARSGGPPSSTKGPTPSGKSQQEYGGNKSIISIPVMDGLTLGEMEDRLLSENLRLELLEDGFSPPIIGGLIDDSFVVWEVNARPTLGQMSEKLRAKNIVRDLSNEDLTLGGPGKGFLLFGDIVRLTLGQMSERLQSQNIMNDVTQEVPLIFGGGGGNGGLIAARGGGGICFGTMEISHVSLPNKMIGAIMGRGGSRINEIRDESGARIDVDKSVMTVPTDERVITIQGTRDQIHSAQFLLQQCVRKYGGNQW